jgi:assimilatory nitrate reductase catalytic subunit
MCSASQQPGSVFAPIHWNDSNASSARVGDLVAPCTDPFSGQPEAKATPAAVAPVAYAYRGLALSSGDLKLPNDAVWARVALAGTSGIVFATNDGPAEWRDLAPGLFGDAVLTEYVDRKRGIYRAAAFSDNRLESALFVGPESAPPQWSDVRGMTDGSGIAESGPVVCACFRVGVAAIAEAITARKASSAEEIGLSLRAGTKCGTCLPEIRSIVAQELHHDVAARKHAHAH